MSKRKPYSRIQAGKTLRKVRAEFAHNTAALAKANAPEWYIRLAGELHDEVEKLIKLRDFIWVQDTADSAVRISDAAAGICPKALKLLTRQEKVATALCGILYERIALGWPELEDKPAGKTTKKCSAKASK